MGIFIKRINKQGAITGMITGLLFTFSYIVYFQFYAPEFNTPDNWLLGISSTGIGAIGALINIAIAFLVSSLTEPTPEEIQDLVDDIRIPSGANVAHHH